jgi:outer membrane immunogenic protein
MKKLLVASVAAAVFCGTPAFAADMPVKAPIVTPVFNWSGFYVGGTAGYSWGDSRDRIVGAVNVTDPYGVHGFAGGGTVGYNWQSAGWVAGVEGDISFSHINGSVSGNSGNFGCGNTCTTDVKDFATARGRLGYAFGQVLPYVTGGFASARVAAADNLIGLPGSITNWQNGWTVGGGVEYAFNNAWSAKVEYLHFNVGDSKIFLVNGFPIKESAQFDIVRAGINYRFGTH